MPVLGGASPTPPSPSQAASTLSVSSVAVAGTSPTLGSDPQQFVATATMSNGSTQSGNFVAVSGVTVTITDRGNAGRSTATDGNGYFSIDQLLAGACTVQFTKTGFGTATRPVILSTDLRIDIAMTATSTSPAPGASPSPGPSGPVNMIAPRQTRSQPRAGPHRRSVTTTRTAARAVALERARRTEA